MKPDKIRQIKTWNELTKVLDMVRDDGAVILLKWDGLREQNKHTVLINKFESDIEQCRHDSDDIMESTKLALIQYIEQGGLR